MKYTLKCISPFHLDKSTPMIEIVKYLYIQIEILKCIFQDVQFKSNHIMPPQNGQTISLRAESRENFHVWNLAAA